MRRSRPSPSRFPPRKQSRIAVGSPFHPSVFLLIQICFSWNVIEPRYLISSQVCLLVGTRPFRSLVILEIKKIHKKKTCDSHRVFTAFAILSIWTNVVFCPTKPSARHESDLYHLTRPFQSPSQKNFHLKLLEFYFHPCAISISNSRTHWNTSFRIFCYALQFSQLINIPLKNLCFFMYNIFVSTCTDV